MLNQFNEEVETYLEEDKRPHCVLCGACVDGLQRHSCIKTQRKREFAPIRRGPYDHYVDESAD